MRTTAVWKPARSAPVSSGGNERGFTLLELIIVMFLAAIIFGIATVFIANALPRGRFNAAARDLASSLRHARTLALTEGSTQVVTIDLDGRKYSVTGKGMKQLPPDVGIKVLDPFSEPVTEGAYAFHFTASGGCDGGTIVLSGPKITVSIVLDPVVGSTVVRE